MFIFLVCLQRHRGTKPERAVNFFFKACLVIKAQTALAKDP